MWTIILAYLVVGAIAGVLAGLLGVGGGLIIVPLLVACFKREGVSPETLMHLSLGTSMATIVFTSISSFSAHHRRGAVHWTAVARIAPGILLGTFLGTAVASKLPTDALKALFVLFLGYVALQMLLDRKPKPSRELPGLLAMSLVGTAIGLISSFVGIGGGAMTVPFMVWCNLPVHRAVGTSAAVGFPIAVSGTAGYIYHGWNQPLLPWGSLGYVHLPALICIASVSMLLAPLGARLAHSLPVARLKRAFALLLVLVGLRMLFSFWE